MDRAARRLALYLAAGLAGALLVSLPARRYRLELASCASWPSTATNVGLSAVYLAAVALLTLCWFGWWTGAPRLRTVLGAGLLVHAVALLAPPYLSMDPLFYAAIGRAMAKFHGSAYAPLSGVLPAGDPILRYLSLDWQRGTSAYFPGWNQLARAVALLSGDSLTIQLRLFQAIGLGAMVATAGVVGLAAHAHKAGTGGRAAAAVLFCPLAVIEGTQAAHNDHLLALSVALFALATVKRRPLSGLSALALGLAIKASALLLLAVDAVALIAGRFRLTAARMAVAAGALVAGAALLASALSAQIARFTPLLSRPLDPLYCNRALECIPRYLLYRFHYFTVAWGLGVAFRVAGGLWLVYVALRAARDKTVLPWAALGILVYYTYLHPYWQAWYLLPLVPLLPFSDERFRPAMVAACLASVSYYAVSLPFNCQRDPTVLLVESVLEIAIIFLPPTVFLLRRREVRSANR